MTLLEQVKLAIKWKRSNADTAAKLGISIQKYKELKRQVNFKMGEHIDLPPYTKNKVIEFKEDLETGTAEIKGIAVHEPRTAEEIIQLLKIDTKKWKLSTYWNKETAGGWMISAFVTAIKKEKKDVLAEVIANFKPEYQPITEVFINNKFDRNCVGIISTQDLHFGKEGNDGIVEHFKNAIKNLVYRAYASHKLDKIVYVIGGDLLNMDTFNGTTTSGTPVDNDMKATEAYQKAFDALDAKFNEYDKLHDKYNN